MHGKAPPAHATPTRLANRAVALAVTLLSLKLSGVHAQTPVVAPAAPGEAPIEQLLARMTLSEKIGQLTLVNADTGTAMPGDLRQAIRQGRVGAVLNAVDVRVVNELQRAATIESRLGIPLLTGRDVLHGFRTVLPIPLGQAATWNPDLIRQGARMAALEAAASGVNWTFAPMIDIARDPRWGRIAESFG
jgi:beta-glucosidase